MNMESKIKRGLFWCKRNRSQGIRLKRVRFAEYAIRVECKEKIEKEGEDYMFPKDFVFRHYSEEN